jgi:hypothetical protein
VPAFAVFVDREALLEFDREMQRRDGGANNPHGRAGKPDGNTLYNIQGGNSAAAPTGTSAQAGIRRLRKAAEEGDQQASELLSKVIDSTSDMSVR